MMKKIGILLSIVALTFSMACVGQTEYPKAPAYIPLPDGEFPIVATCAFYPPFIVDKEFKWAKEAGFNVLSQNQPVEYVDSCLKYAAKNDLYVCVGTYGLNNLQKMQGLLKPFIDNPTVYGFSMYDEPKASKFQTVGEVQTAFNKYARGKQNCFINLLPAMDTKYLEAPSYSAYVSEYVKTVNPAFICFDMYPVRISKAGNIYFDEVYFETISVISDVAKESARPFWSYILCNKHNNYPAPKEEYIRIQVFAALAYGAQGLRYFTYGTPDFDKGKFTDSPIDTLGNRTATWYMVRNVNREVHNLTKVFLGDEVIDVSLTGQSIPKGAKRLERVPAPFRGLESFGKGVIVSHLRNGDQEYLLIINRDINNKQKIRLSRTRAVTRLYGNGTERRETNASITLDKGGYALYRL